MKDAEDDFSNRVGALAKEFLALPKDDQGRLAFVDRVERLLDAPELSPRLRTGLHRMAAEALLTCSKDSGMVARDRLLKHLDSVQAFPIEPEVNDAANLTRLHALLKFGAADGPAINAAAAVAQAVQALDTMLDRPADDPARVGALAYNGSLFLIDQLGLPDQDQGWERLQRLLRLAYEQYVSARLVPQAADAAARFAGIVATRLERSSPSDGKRRELFEAAWPLVTQALANTSAAESPQTWANNNRVAATLVSARPDFSRADNARDAIHYLNRALLAYQDIGDRGSAAACAARLVQEMEKLPPPWTVKMATNLEYYVRLSTGLDDEPRRVEPPALMLIASAWAKVPPSESPGASAKARAAAEQAFAAASDAGHNDLRAYSKILIGNSLLAEAGFLELNAGKARLTASDCSLLERACDAFECAAEYAIACGESAAEAQATRLLGAALGRRVTHCDSPHLVDRALATLRRAVALSPGDERAAAIMNLAGMTLEAFRRGLGGSPQALQDIVDQVRQLLASSDDPRLHDAYKSLSDALEEYELGAATAEGTDRGEHSVSPGTPLRTAYFTVYKSENVPLADGTKSVWRVTLRLFLDKNDRVEGEMRLERRGPTVDVGFSAACPSCRTMREWSLPFIVSFDDDPAAAKRLEEMGRGNELCANCGAALQYQFAFSVRSRAFADSFAIVYPDIWTQSMGPLGLQQLRLAVLVHRSWTEEPLGDVSIPWSAIPAMTIVKAEWARSMKQDMALRLIALGVLGSNDALVKQGLESDPDLWRESQTADADRVKAVLAPELAASGQPAPEMSGLVRLINELLALARRSGVPAVLEQVRRAREVQSAQTSAFESAISLSVDADKRRTFLGSHLSQTPDYSSERSEALYELLLLGSELEIRSMEERGVPKDSLEYRAASALLEGARQHARKVIEQDRKENSSRAAKELILESIDGRRKFALLLRAFSFEGDPQMPSPELQKMTASYGKPNIGFHVLSFGAHKIENIAKAAAQNNVVMVVNVRDWKPARNVEKLFATNQDWQKLVFALIPEASAIILVLPADRAPAPGVLAEIAAIQRLGCLDKTVVVLAEHDDANLLFTQPRQQDGARIDVSALSRIGLRVVLAEADIERDPSLLANAVGGLLSRPGR